MVTCGDKNGQYVTGIDTPYRRKDTVYTPTRSTVTKQSQKIFPYKSIGYKKLAYLVEKLAPALQYSWHTETTASDGGPNNMVINELQVTGLRFKKKDQKWHAVCKYENLWIKTAGNTLDDCIDAIIEKVEWYYDGSNGVWLEYL